MNNKKKENLKGKEHIMTIIWQIMIQIIGIKLISEIVILKEK